MRPARVDRDAFVAARRERWSELEGLILGAETAADWSALASGYRAVCADLARARAEGLPVDVQHYLDQLAGRAHNALYGGRRGGTLGLLRTMASEFPVELRAHGRFMAAASLLFYGPFLVGGASAWLDPEYAALILSPGALGSLEQTWADGVGSRGVGGDASMAGFYVFNNVGIAFRCFATGALAGLGTVFFLVYNGLVIGASFGYLGGVGLLPNLLDFTSGHSAWELTGICVSGAAGLRLGWSLVVTEGRSRAASLREAGPALYRLIVGTFVLLLVAAAIEGFWSAGPAPRAIKYAFGIAQWLIVAAWLLLGGRRA